MNSPHSSADSVKCSQEMANALRFLAFQRPTPNLGRCPTGFQRKDEASDERRVAVQDVKGSLFESSNLEQQALKQSLHNFGRFAKEVPRL